MNKLAYIKNGSTCYLPAWYLERSDEEIEDAKRIMINAPEPEVVKDYSPVLIENEKNIRRELSKEFGFSKSEIEEVIESMYCGRSFGVSVQRQLDKRNK